jgi:hypothetical protein
MCTINSYTNSPEASEQLSAFLQGKTDYALLLLSHFLEEYQKLGPIMMHPTKSMIGVGNPINRIAWVTQLGKNFVHVVFPFAEPYHDNLCFTKIAQVPGDDQQFNHHFRMYAPADVNEEVLQFMLLAYRRQ